MTRPVLVWLRNDLRISDNPALAAALATNQPVVAVHVHETDPTLRPRGAASSWWLHQSLNTLAPDLAGLGIRLEVIESSIRDAVAAHAPTTVFWNRRYGPAERTVDEALKTDLKAEGLRAESFPGNVLVEPFDIATKTGGPYGVYTPFWNAVRERAIPAPIPRPQAASGPNPAHSARLDSAYRTPAWARKLAHHWKVGEAAARNRLLEFLDDITGYPEGRDVPALAVTSRLSPHLAFGEISARQIWHAVTALALRAPETEPAAKKFLMELTWRDFHIHQLFHRPDIATVPMQAKFANLAWRQSEADLEAWQRGETGIPLVDAGMRELWETGFMHNRVRMVVGSLLTKNLLLDWRLGEQWFWDTLVDADPASNPGNWQWVAGCGNDAAPYFRIFNPLTQAERFDPDGAYVRRWAPVPRAPIVDLKSSRERALAAFKAL